MFILISLIKIKFRMGNLLFLFTSQVLSGRNDMGMIAKHQVIGCLQPNGLILSSVWSVSGDYG